MAPIGQSQETSDGSQSLQAGRDIGDVKITNNYGLSITEVKVLVETFVQSSLPVMRETARQEAQRNIQSFLEIFVSQLSRSETASAEEFGRPDTQATFSEAIKGCALRGNNADGELVSKVLIERLSSADKPLLKLVCDEAIRVIPNLTRSHISYLALLQYTMSVKHTSFTELFQLEATHKKILPFVIDGFNISTANIQYLASLGLVTINAVADANTLPGNMRRNYPFMPATDGELVAMGAPSIATILQEYAKIGPTVFLTGTGQLIGMQHLAAAFGSVDMEVWIK